MQIVSLEKEIIFVKWFIAKKTPESRLYFFCFLSQSDHWSNLRCFFSPAARSKRFSLRNQFGSMPVLEKAKTMVYVTNHNMITMAMAIFKTSKMADKGEERVLTEILVYSCFIEPFICLLLTMNSEVP